MTTQHEVPLSISPKHIATEGENSRVFKLALLVYASTSKE